jgi:hypothetical protein
MGIITAAVILWVLYLLLCVLVDYVTGGDDRRNYHD